MTLFQWSAWAVALLIWSFATTAQAFDPQRVQFTVGFDGFETDLSIMSTVAKPGSALNITTSASAKSESGLLTKTQTGWKWKAPELPGLHTIRFQKDKETIKLNIFVLTPWRNGAQYSLNGYKVGAYAKRPFKGLPVYKAPPGLAEVRKEHLDLRVSPHFTLKQFMCKQQPGHNPSYILINAQTLVKLESLLAAVNERGWKTETFHVMSGFRTPHYNRSIGNKTTSSRHLYGGAADIFIDMDGDGWMDDLDGNARIDKDDARVLAGIAESLSKAGQRQWPRGGIGVYAENSVRGPFVHIDARGYRARW